MTALSTHDALAKGLCAWWDQDDDSHDVQDVPCGPCWRMADALLASGVVIDAPALADDEALMRAWSVTHFRGLQSEAAQGAGASLLAQYARSLAAALSKRT